MGKFRDGMPVKAEAVTLILAIDRIKEILAGLEATETEPEGTDEDLIEKLHAMAEGATMPSRLPRRSPWSPHRRCSPRSPRKARWSSRCWNARLRPGEVSLDDLERAFRETETEARPRPSPRRQAGRAGSALQGSAKEATKAKPAKRAAVADDVQEADKIANQSIRVNVDTLEHLMTMVSELVLTRNQLLEISRRNEDTEFKVPLQRSPTSPPSCRKAS